MTAECHYKNGLIKYHELPVPFPVGGSSGKPIFKVAEPVEVVLGNVENLLKNPAVSPIHTFEFSHNKDWGGSQIPVFNEV